MMQMDTCMEISAVMFLQTVWPELLVVYGKDLQCFALLGHAGDIVPSGKGDRLLNRIEGNMHAKDQEKTRSNKTPTSLQFQTHFIVLFSKNKTSSYQLPPKYDCIYTI